MSSRIRWFAWVVASAALVGCASEPGPAVSRPAPPSASALAALDAMIEAHPVDTTAPEWRQQVPRPAPLRFTPDRKYYWLLYTNQGLIKIEFLADKAPRHVSTMMYLTRLGFFDGLVFHRIIPGFMAQGGDPTGTGTGGPGFKYAGEFPKRGAPKHDARGVLSMANSGPRTDGSQFFILFKEAPHLDGKHTIFGQVVEGMGTLRGIEVRGSEDGTPLDEVIIERAELREEALH